MRSTFAHHELPNGLRVVCEAMPHVNSFAAGFLVRTGSRHETPPIHGVSHFLEHMCFKGTATRNCHDINVRFDELGSIYNAFTSKEHTFYHGWVPADRSDEQIELLADMMRPALPKADFEMERNVILEEIAQSDDSFDRHVSSFLHEQLFGTHPLAHEVLGEKETIAGLPLDLMVEYHGRRYSPRNVVLISAGNVDPQQVFSSAGRYCGHWTAQNGSAMGTAKPKFAGTAARKAKSNFANTEASSAKLNFANTAVLDAEADSTAHVRHGGRTLRADADKRAHGGPTPPDAPAVTEDATNVIPPLPVGVRKLVLPQFQQQAIVLLYPGVPQSHAAGESIEAFSTLFGGPNSRCFWNIVQKGICTHAGASWIAYADCGYMALYAYGEPERCEQMVDALRGQADLVSRDGFRGDEVNRVKNHRRTHLALEAETPRSRISQIMDDLECFGHVRSSAARLEEAERVSPASIARYLREFPIAGEGLMLSMGPRDWPA